MKKILVVLLALMVVGGVFAQATVNGYVRDLATIDKDGNMTNAVRSRLNLNFTSEDKNLKMFTRLQSSDMLAPTVSYAWGSVKMLDGMAKITAGKLGNYDYNIGTGVSEFQLGNISNDGYALDGFKGMLVQVYPVEGLDIGLAIKPAGTAIGLSTFGLNAVYAISGVGNVVFESTFAEAFGDSRLSASFKFTGMENLTASAGFKGLLTQSVYAVVDYSMGDISIEVAPEYNITDAGIYAEGYVSYAMGMLTFNVLGAFDQNKVNLSDTVYFGVEAIYAPAKGAKLLAGVNYDAANGVSIPLEARYSF